ncbi:MAG: LamG domain-containing protein, partial [Gammaproteobacteria bacterium]|nr:LamG domain-containing protein [Gammaproteobacteria bacterium]
LVPFVRFNQASSGNTYRVDASSTYPTDGQTWMHIAVTFDGSDIRLYINGVEEGILNAPGLSINQNNLALSFGAQDDGTYPFFGEIDEVYLYNYAITPAEILALSTAGQEPDTDGDGVPDSLDAFPLDPLEWADNDNDGIGDNADTDDDNDGMPDLWEIQYGFDPLNAADAALDADGDGVSNLDEYLAGTVPVSQTPVGSWNLDENSGLVANDSSPHGNHGSLNGSPIWVTGVRGSALSLGGGNDRVLINDDPTLDVSSQMSLSVWIRPTQIYTQYILKKARANTNDGFELGLSGNGRVPFIRFNQSSSGNSYRVDATSLYPTDGQTWMHIAATYDGNTIRLYIDGIEEGSLSAPGLIIGQNNLPLSIGAQDDGLYPFTGAIDEVHVYDFAITASDVLALSNADQVVDTDGDGVPDDLDAFPLDPLEWADNDGDGIGDNADTDDDNDGMPDEWEIQYGFDPLNAADALLDADGDGVSNLDEYLGGTNPLPVDTDGDGVPDSQDAFPLDPLEWADNDGDGIGDNADPDDDNDLMPDVWEIQYGMNPFDPTDAALDYDGDGFTNLEEYLAGTNPLPQSQVGLWTLDDNGGSVAIDGSPNGNHGTINGAPSWVPGISGSALSFGGGADRVVVADAPSLDVSTAMSLAVWIRPTQVYTQYVIKKARPNATDGFELSLSSGGIPFIRFNQASSGNSYRVDGTTPYPSDGQTWMHIAATFDGSVIRLFVNGVEEGSLSAPGMVIGQNNLPFSIGAQDDGAFPFTGTLDEVYLYDYAITASDVIGLVSAAPGSDTLLAYQKDTLSTITATADVGEKPQSKVWQFDNYFWMVLPDDTGTWVWRLDGTSWTKVYKISNDTVVRADVKLASDVTGLVHAVLHSGNTTQLVSLEYVPSPAPSYQPWATRPSIVSLPNGNGAEAATLDIDSTGLMWVVRDVNNTVEVRYSAAPYSDWSAPAVVLDNINVDDIATISQVGTTGIGVMWSNQDIRLFGFSYHSDLDPPNVWSAAEYPGDANALNLGSGLADDHINLATTSDGTLYAAVKSGYNNPNVTTVGLFVRSPAGSWSDLIDIDSTSGSTRPIVAVNEVDSTVSIFFSTDSFGGSIAYREASTTDLVFGLSRTLMSSSVLTNTSSMKQNYVDSLVIMSSATQFASPTVQVESILLTK